MAKEREFETRAIHVGQAADPTTGALWTLSTQGELLGQIMAVFPAHALPLAAISAGERLACVTASGIGYLNPGAEAAGQGTERRAGSRRS